MPETIRSIIGKPSHSSVFRAVPSIYQTLIRSRLPGRPLVYAGIPVSYDRKWGDAIIPPSWRPDTAFENGLTDEPGYEVALIEGLRESIRAGDHVVVVGGGIGVTAVVAALQTGASGTVACFEGSAQYVEHIQETARRNQVSNITVHHAVVSEPIAVYGDQSDLGAVIPPAQLPECDVLELDCEGAELDILRNMTIRPRAIVVETHGAHGAPTPLVDSLLKELGYDVRALGLAEPRLKEICVENDIHVLLASRADSQSDLG